MRIGRARFVGLGAALVLLTLVVGNSGQVGMAQAQCTVNVQPGKSIQHVIDNAVEGSVICLGEEGAGGSLPTAVQHWSENVVITKSLTLRGLHPRLARISGIQSDKPVIAIKSETEIEVTLENLTVAEGKERPDGDGIQIHGKAKVSLKNIQILDNADQGIEASDSATITLVDSRISNNGDGLDVEDSATVNVINSQISGNRFRSLFANDSARVSYTDSQLSNNKDGGLDVRDSVVVNLTNSQIHGNGERGVDVSDSATVNITNSQITGNYGNGLAVRFSGKAIVTQSQLSGNGSGVELRHSARVELKDAWISDNRDCGISRAESASVTGQNNWVWYNVRNFCAFGPSEEFLRPENDPPRPLLESAEVCPQGCAFIEVAPAIWAVRPGAKVRVQAGTYAGGVTIVKSLTLQGSGNEQTILNGQEESAFGPVITIASESEIDVAVTELTTTGAKDPYGLAIGSRAKVTLRDIRISKNQYRGLSVKDSAQVSLIDSQISHNDTDGILAEGSAAVTLINSQVSDNASEHFDEYAGIFVKDLARVSLTKSQVSDNKYHGLFVQDSAQVSLTDSIVSASDKVGLLAQGTAKVTLVNSQIKGSAESGLSASDTAQVAITNSQLSENGEDGLSLKNSATADVRDTSITDNSACGISLSDNAKVTGHNNLIEDNDEDLCDFSPPEDFLRTMPSQTLLAEAEVCSKGCAFTALAPAVRAVRPGGIVRIQAGTYSAGVTITKSLTLRGVGSDQTILKGKARSKFVINIKSEDEIDVMLEGLSVTAASTSGIDVSGHAKVALTNVRAFDISNREEFSAGIGLHVADSAQVTLAHSQLSENQSAGLVVEGSARVDVANSQVSDNRGDGIFAKDYALVSVMNSTISGSTILGYEGEVGGGLSANDFATMEVRDSIIKDNQGCGIVVFSEKAHVHGTPNEMRGNGADLCGYASASLRRPLVLQSVKTQLSVPGDYKSLQEAVDAIAAGGTIRLAAGNYSESITLWKPVTLQGRDRAQTFLKLAGQLAISVISETKGAALENLTVTGTQRYGLLVYGQVKLQDVQISDNQLNGKGIGLLVKGRAQVILINSQVSDNFAGLDVANKATVNLVNTQISNNFTFGLGVTDEATVTLNHSQVSDNKEFGVICGTDSRLAKLTLTDSKVSNNGVWGLAVLGSAQVNLTHSTLSSNNVKGTDEGGGITVRGSAIASLNASTLSGNGWIGLEAKEFAKVNVIDSVISDNKVALFADGTTTLTVAKSRLSSNAHGFLMVGSSKLTLTDSKVSRNFQGIDICSPFFGACTATASLENAQISDNGGEGLTLFSGNVSIKKSLIAGNGGDGLRVFGVKVNLQNTQISGNKGAGVALVDGVVEAQDIWISDNMCGISSNIPGAPEVSLEGHNNWVRNNAQDFCGSAPPESFLRTAPPRPLLDETSVCAKGCPFTEVGPAIWAVRPGGVVHVRAGTYQGGLLVTKDLTLEGAGKEQTIISDSLTDGIQVLGSTRVQLKNLKISKNESNGLVVGCEEVPFPANMALPEYCGAATIEVRDSLISGNGNLEDCESYLGDNPVCNGILVANQSQLTLIDSVVTDSAEWGLAAFLQQCTYPTDTFTGRVVFEGKNVIEGNNKKGHLKDKGNPGNHPFKNLPDGQVCLP